MINNTYKNTNPVRTKYLAGFTLAEVVFVVAIISVVLIFSIPHIRSAKIQANETDALSSLGKISAAMEVYRILYKTYPDSFSRLLNVNPTLTAPLVIRGSKGGYNFSLLFSLSTLKNSYAVVADPIISGETGNRKFKVDETGTIYRSPFVSPPIWSVLTTGN